MYSFLYKPESETPTEIDMSQLISYGVVITNTAEFRGLTIQMDNENYHNYYFEIGLFSGVKEEADFYNMIHFRVSYKNPPCEFDFVDLEGAESPEIEISVFRGSESNTTSLSEIFK